MTQFHPPPSPSLTSCSFHNTNTCMSVRFNLQSAIPLSSVAALASQEHPDMNLHLCIPNLSQPSQITLNNLMTCFPWMSFQYCQWDVSKRELLISSIRFQQFLPECLVPCTLKDHGPHILPAEGSALPGNLFHPHHSHFSCHHLHPTAFYVFWSPTTRLNYKTHLWFYFSSVQKHVEIAQMQPNFLPSLTSHFSSTNVLLS